jgi:hypothetical protein
LAAAAGLAWSAEAVVHRLRPVRSDPARYFLYDVVHDVEPLIARVAELGVPSRRLLVSRHAAYPFLYYSRGRLASADVTGILERDFGATLERWLPTLDGGPGWLLLLDEEAEGGRRMALAERGWVVEEEAAARGVRLWRVSRPSPPRTR